MTNLKDSESNVQLGNIRLLSLFPKDTLRFRVFFQGEYNLAF